MLGGRDVTPHSSSYFLFTKMSNVETLDADCKTTISLLINMRQILQLVQQNKDPEQLRVVVGFNSLAYDTMRSIRYVEADHLQER